MMSPEAQERHFRTLQIIYFGRAHCPALYHDLDACPICSWAATKKRKAEERRARPLYQGTRNGRSTSKGIASGGFNQARQL